MKDSKMVLMREWAATEAGPFCNIAKASTQQGIVLVTQLETRIESAGYSIEFEDTRNGGAWCRVFKEEEGSPTPVMKAQGFSSAGREDALLFAVWGACREEQDMPKLS
jgi:hypothetical protein